MDDCISVRMLVYIYVSEPDICILDVSVPDISVHWKSMSRVTTRQNNERFSIGHFKYIRCFNV